MGLSETLLSEDTPYRTGELVVFSASGLRPPSFSPSFCKDSQELQEPITKKTFGGVTGSPEIPVDIP